MAGDSVMLDAATRTELSEAFGAAVDNHEDVMLECLSICRLYSLPPSELFYKHEAYILSLPSTSSSSSTLTLASARELRGIIQRDQIANAGSLATSSSEAGAAGKGTPKVGGAGMRKVLGTNGDLGGFLDSLATPSRSSTSTPNSLRRPHPYKDSSTPSGSNSTGTPNRPSPMTATKKGSGSASRPTSLNPIEFSTPSRAAFSRPALPGQTASSLNPGSSPITADTPTSSQPFAHRPQPLSLLETLNSQLSPSPGIPFHPPVPNNPLALSAASKAQSRVKLSMTAHPGDWEYRYMFEKIGERADASDAGVEEWAEGFRESWGVGELGDPGAISEESIYVVGRIISAQTDSGKPTDSSLFLESSRALGDGKRVPLRFAPDVKVRGNAPGSKGFGVFKGCLVGMKGRNGGGGSFLVEEMLLPPPSEMNVTPPSQLLQYQFDKLNGQPISVMLAAGPYTLDTDVLFEPLEALMEAARVDRPDVLILLGPFIDSQHPLIKVGDIDETPLELFRSQVASRITLFSEVCPGSSIIILPSVRDLVSRHMAFPQAPLDKGAVDLALPKKAKLVPNPCTFFINETMIAVSSVDVLFHLRKEEYFRKAEEAEPDAMSNNVARDSMADLCRHVLGQKSFYPIFPCPEEVASEINLDVTHQHLIKMEDRAPDILILPSRLKHFAKIVDNVVAVNPGFLSKSANPGTFVKMAIHPMEKVELNEGLDKGDEEREHKVYERARVEILRI